MAKQKIRQTEVRNEAIWMAYNDLIAELGNRAPAVSMKWKYTELGEKFFLQPKTISMIISKKMRAHNASNKREIRAVYQRKWSAQKQDVLHVRSDQGNWLPPGESAYCIYRG